MQGASAVGAAVQSGIGPRKMGAQPMTPRGALRVDALHGPAGQILHGVSLSCRPSRWPGFQDAAQRPGWREFCRHTPVVSSEKTTSYSGTVAGANLHFHGGMPFVDRFQR